MKNYHPINKHCHSKSKRKHLDHALVLLVVLVMAGMLIGLTWPFSSPTPTLTVKEASVVHIQDGDTLTAVVGGKKERIRIIGVDTPELDDAPHGESAKRLTEDYLEGSLEGKRVWLAYDNSSLYDKYDRLLAYVWFYEPELDLETMSAEILTGTLNGRLVSAGYADAMTIEPHTTFAGIFEQAAKSARERNIGLWPTGVFN